MQATALYRHFNEAGDLLYVGISMRPFTRASEHRQNSSWFIEVTRIDIEWFGTRTAAEQAEYEAIRREHPRHNRAFADALPYESTPDDPDEMFTVITDDMMPAREPPPFMRQPETFEEMRQRLAAERAENVRIRAAQREKNSSLRTDA